MAALLSLMTWPFAAWHSLKARRRLKGYLHGGDGRLTLERVA